MATKLFVNVTPEGSRILLVQDNEILEYHVEGKDELHNVGDIYVGVVKKLVPGLNAAFVDIKHDKDAFIHYTDLGFHFNSIQQFLQRIAKSKKTLPTVEAAPLLPSLEKEGSVSTYLQRGQKVLVRLTKEAISNKSLRVSAVLALPGRYMLLVPFGNSIKFSKKIRQGKERRRLQQVLGKIKPANFSLVVRKEAENKELAVLEADLKDLHSRWQQGVETLAKAQVGDKIIGELKRTTSILRDVLNEQFDQIIVDDPDLYEEVRAYVRNIKPDKEGIVSFYERKTPIFEHFGLEKQLRRLLSPSVDLPGGGNILVEKTEAMYVIDVNSGSRTHQEKDQESTAVQVNLEAAKEVARQLRLRAMGGIITVDFISMDKPEHRRRIQEVMREALKADRVKSNIYQLSKLCLMHITRERTRATANFFTKATCTFCKGTGDMRESRSLQVLVSQHLERICGIEDGRKVTLVVHPHFYAYLRAGWPFCSILWKWRRHYWRWITLEADEEMPYTGIQLLYEDAQGIPQGIEY